MKLNKFVFLILLVIILPVGCTENKGTEFESIQQSIVANSKNETNNNTLLTNNLIQKINNEFDVSNKESGTYKEREQHWKNGLSLFCKFLTTDEAIDFDDKKLESTFSRQIRRINIAPMLSLYSVSAPSSLGQLGEYWWCIKDGKEAELINEGCAEIVEDVKTIKKSDKLYLILIGHSKLYSPMPVFLGVWSKDKNKWIPVKQTSDNLYSSSNYTFDLTENYIYIRKNGYLGSLKIGFDFENIIINQEDHSDYTSFSLSNSGLLMFKHN
ncbi:hypothetical protein H1S01_19330 [Heliobacterium chlorum]|uniref:Uncharacterized protein n=1 Tax=Heliobacterium chlorum TaxID=2698 RepID=A0ABR7T872_HELCL|nr:hypothetical protein [Heliobacterium chlorum]MBC9786600.1 hypothetical protein [Heliobacterium chlorum]